MTERNDAFDQVLDDCYPVYTIGVMEFSASQILYECDPIAYRIGASEYESYLEEEED
jgi:hypothetical protein